MTASYPATIIVYSKHENPRKCSILPLRGRGDTHFVCHPPAEPLDLSGYVRLAPDGPALTSADRCCGLLLIDASWHRADSIARQYGHVPARSLCGFKTAYPRQSKWHADPENGLASIEALFVAYHILGRPVAGLLDHYRWSQEFLNVNGLAVPN